MHSHATALAGEAVAPAAAQGPPCVAWRCTHLRSHIRGASLLGCVTRSRDPVRVTPLPSVLGEPRYAANIDERHDQ